MILEATTQTTPALTPGASIIREISADLETPISVYMKLRGTTPSFLLESVEGGERIARYSFIGVQPRAQYILREGQVEIKTSDETSTIQYSGDPTYFLQEEMNRYKLESQAEMNLMLHGSSLERPPIGRQVHLLSSCCLRKIMNGLRNTSGTN